MVSGTPSVLFLERLLRLQSNNSQNKVSLSFEVSEMMTVALESEISRKSPEIQRILLKYAREMPIFRTHLTLLLCKDKITIT